MMSQMMIKETVAFARLDPFYRLLSRRKGIREEEQARQHRKVGRPTKWTLRSTLGAFPMDTFRNETNIAALTN
jgi:hypothetical protein